MIKKILLFSLLITLAFAMLNSCSSDSKSSSSDRKIVKTKKSDSKINGTSDMNTVGPVSVKRYDIPAGADPKISAEDGGKGFDKIAKSLGFVTNNDFNLEGDPKAKKGGSFTMSFTEFPSTFRTEGKVSNSYVNSMMGNLIYETLLNLDRETQDYKPTLATHWKISDDKLTFWFRLNPDARWNDGKRVTTDDVIATWNLLTDPEIMAPGTNMQYGKYEMPIAESKYIFSIKCKKIDWYLFYIIAAGTNIYPAHHINKIDGASYLEKYHWKMFPGSGPYVLDEKNTSNGNYITLRRRSDYWGENLKNNIGKFNFNRLKYITIRDEVLQKEKFKNGDIDFYMVGRAQWWVNEFNLTNPVPSFDALKNGLVQKRKVYNFMTKGTSGIFFNMRKAPFDDLRIRKAFAHLWNRDQLIEKLFFNEYKKIRSAFPGSVYENEENTIYELNPTKAAKLLDEAGWKKRDSEGYRINSNGERFQLELKIRQSSERIYTPLQEDLKKAGIQLDLKITDGNSLFKSGNERRFKIHAQAWSVGFFPNPESSFHSKYADPDNTANFSGVKNDRIDELCEKYRVSFDSKEKLKIIKEMDKIISEIVHVSWGWYTPFNRRILYWNKFGMPASCFSYGGDWKEASSLWWYEAGLDKELKAAKLDHSKTMEIGDTVVDFWGKLKTIK